MKKFVAIKFGKALITNKNKYFWGCLLCLAGGVNGRNWSKFFKSIKR